MKTARICSLVSFLTRLSSLLIWPTVLALASPDARAFSPQPLTPPDMPVIGSEAASDRSGGVLTSWMEERDGEWRVRVQRLDAAGRPLWAQGTATVGVTTGPVAADSGTLITPSSDGGVLVAWAPENAGPWKLQKLTGEGTQLWPDGGVVLPGGWCSGVIPDGEGGAFVQGWPGLSHVQAAGMIDWSHDFPVLECSGTRYAETVRAVSDQTGGVVYAQLTNCAEERIIRVWRISRQGGHLWSPEGVTVYQSPALAASLVLSASADGSSFHVGWADLRSPSNGLLPRVQRLNAEGVPQWEAGGVPASDGQSGSAFARPGFLGLLSRGRQAYVLWPAGRSRMTAQMLSGTGEPLWGAGVILKDHNCSVAEQVRLVSDAQGGVIASWAEVPEWDCYGTASFAIYAQRLDSTGSKLWGEAPRAVRPGNYTPIRLAATVPAQGLLVYQSPAMLWAHLCRSFSPPSAACRRPPPGPTGSGWKADGSFLSITTRPERRRSAPSAMIPCRSDT